jgi:hypothetical protein
MMDGRIFFEGNPWPEGHPISEFRWVAERRGQDVWFGFHLETADYDSEREPKDDESVEYLSNWHAPGVWGNFHRCTISSDYWHEGGYAVCPADQFSAGQLDGMIVRVDPLPQNLEVECEERAFHIYLLGHDAVADHKILFARIEGTDLFDITWEGKIALAYVGDYEPRYRFKAVIKGARLPDIGNSVQG